MQLKEKIENTLRQVIDPETSMDVMRMQLVKCLKVDEHGAVSLTFMPSSPHCPLGFQLAIRIQNAIKQIEGVTDIRIEVDGYVNAEALKKILAENASD